MAENNGKKRPGIIPSISYAGLIAMLSIYMVNAVLNYEVKTGGDEHQYLRMANSFLDERFDIGNEIYEILDDGFPDERSQIKLYEFDNRNPDGKVVPQYSVGIALILTPFYAVSGQQVWWVVPVFFDIVLIISLFVLTIRILEKYEKSVRYAAALLTVASYGTIVNFTFGIRRDGIAAVMTTLVSLIVLEAFRRKRAWLWHLAAGTIAFLVTVKITYVLLYLPYCLLLFTAVRKEGVGRGEVLRHGAITLIVHAVVLAPLFLHNAYSTGNPFLLTQLSGETNTFKPRGDTGSSLLRNLTVLLQSQSLALSPNSLPSWSSVLVGVILLAGVWPLRKSHYFKFWVLPTILLFYGFHVLTRRAWYAYYIYLSPTYGLLMVMFSCGILAAFSHLKKRGVLVLSAGAIVLLPFLAIKAYRSLPDKQHPHFRVHEANHLARDLGDRLENGAVVLCDRHLAYAIELFTPFYSFPLRVLDTKDGSWEEKIDYLVSQGHPVYFCDYKGLEGTAEVYGERIRKRFELELVRRKQKLYHFRSVYNSPPPSIYRLRDREEVESSETEE